MDDDVLRFSHSGTRYLLGFGEDFFGIWDRRAPDRPVERYPRTDEGWRQAWLRFVTIEERWVDVPPVEQATTASGAQPSIDPAQAGQAVQAVLASPVARLGARILDGLLVAAVLTALVVGDVVEVEGPSLQDVPTRLIVLMMVVGFLYEVPLIALRGQTLGKMALRIAVVRAVDEGNPGLGPALIRWMIPAVASIVPFGTLAVYLWLVWDRRRQGLHDKAAQTLVITSRR